jgi:DNA-binding NtrC family response regulator
MSRGAGRGRLCLPGGPEREACHYPPLNRILTTHPGLMRLLASLPRYARTDLPVLILGEPGTGKDLVAEALWALSSRASQPFIRLNCANLGAELAGSELFGHLKGSFTGAERTRPGKFKAAHRGTLFLDEVGDLPLEVQPRLLRALDQGEIEPVGGDKPVKVDVRLIAATNQNLPRLIALGKFRQDVYDRLAVLVIRLPPLRERGEDILFLANFFLQKEASRYQRRIRDFSEAAQRRLQAYHWPGNVRELRNVVTRAVLFSQGPLIQVTDLHFAPARSAAPGYEKISGETDSVRPDQEELVEMLWEEKGNISALARRLQVCSRTIYRWLKSYGVDLEKVRLEGTAGRENLADGAGARQAAR